MPTPGDPSRAGRARERARDRSTAAHRLARRRLHDVAAADGDEVKLRRVTQIVSTSSRAASRAFAVLDLACLEGMRRSSSATRRKGRGDRGARGEPREGCFAAGRSASSGRLRQGDVRGLDRASHGKFDVVLCLGILYHLDHPDVFGFVEQMASVCRRRSGRHPCRPAGRGRAGARRQRLPRPQPVRARAVVDRRGARSRRCGARSTIRAHGRRRDRRCSTCSPAAGSRASTSASSRPSRAKRDRVTLLALKGKAEARLVAPAPPRMRRRCPSPRWEHASPGPCVGTRARRVAGPLRTRVRRLLGEHGDGAATSPPTIRSAPACWRGWRPRSAS